MKTSDRGNIPLNQCQYPTGGISLRDTAFELQQRGFINRRGKPFHPYQVDEMLDAAFPVAAAKVLRVELTTEVYAG